MEPHLGKRWLSGLVLATSSIQREKYEFPASIILSCDPYYSHEVKRRSISLLLQPETSLPESIHLPCLFHREPKMTSNCMVMHRGRHSAQASGSLSLQLFVKNLCASSIVMMEPTQDWEGENLATSRMWWH